MWKKCKSPDFNFYTICFELVSNEKSSLYVLPTIFENLRQSSETVCTIHIINVATFKGKHQCKTKLGKCKTWQKTITPMPVFSQNLPLIKRNLAFLIINWWTRIHLEVCTSQLREKYIPSTKKDIITTKTTSYLRAKSIPTTRKEVNFF